MGCPDFWDSLPLFLQPINDCLTQNYVIMEIKLRANIVMSKNLTIEANDWVEAVEKARTMMAEPIPYKELTPTRVFYDEISPINWMSDEKYKELCATQRL